MSDNMSLRAPRSHLTRRQFLATASTGTLAAALAGTMPAYASAGRKAGKCALLGGTPLRAKPFQRWPVWDKAAEEPVLEILRSGKWFRGSGTVVSQFEEKYAALLGAKRCVATMNGTNSLATALHCLDVGVGDEVIVSPYTFIATYNVVLNAVALPVFADTDPETFLINPDKIEEKITENTRAILPVHIFGLPCNMGKINALAKKRNLKVIEDACQAWLAEWNGKKCGTLGDLGCFSFQESKHLPAGEGGAVVGNDEALMDHVMAFHNCGRVKGKSGYPIIGHNRRMTEYQAAILLNQMQRLEAETVRRTENANYLTSKIKDIPGIVPHKLCDGATRAVYHLYPMRYQQEQFGGLSRNRFMAALSAEGIPCSSVYGPQYKDGLIEAALTSKNFTRAFPKARLDRYREELHYPGNEQLCQEAVCFTQNMFLGPKSDMDDIANAIQKVYENRKELLKS